MATTTASEGTALRVAIIVPTYNEAENLESLAGALLALGDEYEVVIVDDRSPDGTGEIADRIASANERFNVIHRSGPKGYAAASREGMAWCIRGGCDAVMTMDADLSHDPAVVPVLAQAVADGADVAIGSRFVPGGALVVDWGPTRRAVSEAGSAYARFMVGTRVRDCTSGFRCYRASSLAGAGFERIGSDGYCFLIELLAAFHDRGSAIVEVPITYTDRRAGASKISRAIIFEALVRTTRLGVAGLLGVRRRAGRRVRATQG